PDELTGRIRALCDVRRSMQKMREQIDRLQEATHRNEQLIASARHRDEQLRLAGQIQMDLLPEPLIDADPLTVSTLYLPADHISGDIYDVARPDAQRYSLPIAHPARHGLPAARPTILVDQRLRG